MPQMNALTRLCIVLYGLGVTLTPPIGWFIIATESHKWARDMYDLCVKSVGNNYSLYKQCGSNLMEHKGPEALPLMWKLFQGSVVIGGVLWLLCWGSTLTIRWVLAGRNK